MFDTFSSRELMAADRVLQHVLRTDFSAFLEKTFSTVSPGQIFYPNWHLDAIAYALERVAKGEIKRLIVLVPPRNLKSIAASVALPAYLLGQDPTQRIICVSYSSDLANKHARDCRAVMMSPWYQAVFPRTRIDPSKNAEAEFTTTQRGFRLSTSTGGTLTGRGGNILVIDDPLKPADAQSDPRRQDCQQWYTNTLLSRLDDKVHGAIIVVMQRLHMDDLAGYLMAQGGWEILELPAIAETRQIVPIGPGRLYTRSIGEVLHPDREPLFVLEQLRAEMGSYDFSAQYQQAPVPSGGAMIRWEWFQCFKGSPPPRDGSILVQSWDTASTTNDRADYSVGITARVDKTGDIYILDLVRGRWGFPDLLREVKKAHGCHRPRSILVEDHGSGIGLIQMLKNDRLPIVGMKSTTDKVSRMVPHTATLEAGKVFVKDGAPWLDELRTEVLSFPHGRHDDQVDALSQLMTWDTERRKKTAGSVPIIWQSSARPPWGRR
jgi:predicted phage terminase large subunit-like protein